MQGFQLEHSHTLTQFLLLVSYIPLSACSTSQHMRTMTDARPYADMFPVPRIDNTTFPCSKSNEYFRFINRKKIE